MVDDGTFTIANIPPGQYALTLPNIGGTYVKTVRAGGSDIMGAPLDLTQNAPGPIEIVLAKDVGQLTIAPLAEAKDAQTVRQIVLWPKQPLGLLQTSGVVALSLGGQAKVAPGDFYLAAFEDADTASVRAYGFLALFNDLATEVTLKVGEPVTGEAAVISHEAMEAVLASLP
jgi:hypothetical protein